MYLLCKSAHQPDVHIDVKDQKEIADAINEIYMEYNEIWLISGCDCFGKRRLY